MTDYEKILDNPVHQNQLQILRRQYCLKDQTFESNPIENTIECLTGDEENRPWGNVYESSDQVSPKAKFTQS